ncbi:MAG: hypothetical protein ACTSSL_10445 [Candidatus Heimdallarchaeaceae archaeon]
MTKTKSILPIWQATFILTSCHVEKEPRIIFYSSNCDLLVEPFGYLEPQFKEY